ncbi:preprotein translocase subunit SecD [Natrarchaeobius halalkaliphilus]|uniref:Protein-export membrane protein SecD n=1 Tax=Natrarchaeobius halalkaliphilus TaxID=1679091 RepID=A0A3N6M8H6_9EURY|nr:preprotein translocase subunit SecD [Natrarchaeobius halalkaliphilus]RQG91671.1 preprotein translocase subunit SecD [Natrarchaeobius halalkaliphilus]
MSPVSFLKEHWRIVLLVAFISVALVALFVPGGIVADDSLAGENESVDDNPTNIEYGLGLDGGTRVSAPPTGMTADNLDIEHDEQRQVASALYEYDYENTDLETRDATVRFHEEENRFTAEIFTDEVTPAEFAAALESADVGLEVSEDDIEEGVTQQTRDEIIQTIELRINEAGLDGGSAYQEATLGGQYYIVTEVPGMTPDELRDLLSDRGDVRIVAYYPDEDGNQTNETVLQGEGIADSGVASYNDERGYHYVPITVDGTEDEDENSPASEYQAAMNEHGFTGEGQGRCHIQDREADEFDFDPDDPQWCLLTVVDDEVIDAHSMGDGLADNMRTGTWENDPTFEMIVPSQQDAHFLAVNLQSGALTAPLDFERDQTFTLQPALADQFKLYSLLIGGLAVLTVCGMIFLRYRDPRVAAPMFLTAMAEVLILLGFAAAIRMPLDLSHVAGFIAVVGTGVDDLVIIADEVMDEGDVNSRRVFESRFRKAFWIIGAAAATTIIALSPLAVLSLGDLRGFAIITILGVLIGVLITRPAYGDILQRLLTDK